jgi:DNA-binding SARP family transcriptional activator
LFVLALRAGSTVRTEAIIDALLPEADFDRSLTAVRHAMHHVRRLLAPYTPVHTVSGGYRLDPEPPLRLDTADFTRLVASGRRGRGADAQAALEGAVALYGGTLLEGMDDDWVVQPRAEMEAQFLLAAQLLLGHYERARAHHAAAMLCQRVLTVDPFHEGFHLAMLRHQVALGHVSAARRHYSHYGQLMQDAFGRGPDPAARRILAQGAQAGA